ncbi:SH3 domain-containing protein [Clostridium sp. LIBA-8841]|uniref:SH3 domain-containing protein n=1 Tax=Clostridium sp. LIBA-8841 TaxID=2987530 RepID=UPI002AC5BA2C|nr:SH3 domain-containing protein [Clostridium sp. LIBA-8841]MDZ5255151.1 SH3 domain-containing protein [Clostridium sp. LIBA-8841]
MANNIIPNVGSGDLVGSTPTFPTNAVVRGDFLYLRDVNGNQIPGRTVSDGDEITVLFISNEKNIVLVQYPTGSGYRQGYVTNATSIIKYKDDYSWVNGSTPEPVYDFDKTTQIGTLDPRERAVVLYKVGGMTYVAYDTGKGKLTKSGLVHYEGSGSSTGGGSFNGVAPGEVVPGGFTYDNNAEVVGDELYLRDANGNLIPGRSVSVGDKITVLDVGYTKQLALVQYPAGNVVRQGYVTNATNLIRYFNQYSWHNGSTPEEVLDENGGHLGSLNPYEAATPLYEKNGMKHVVYDTDKGPNTKSGYVKYEGSAATRVDIPYPSITNAQKIVYGTSGRGRELAAYKVGNGSNSLVFVCAIHGWEDNWPADGIELTRIGNGLIEHFQNASTNNWSLYIIPVANPDGLSEGFTNNGPGRCTIVGAVDCNRDFPLGFSKGGVPRYHSGNEPLSVPESRGLRNFIQGIKNRTSGEMCVIDLHGWEGAAIGNPEIGQYFRNQFGFEQRYGYGDDRGFMIGWAKSIGAKAALIELPGSTKSHSDVVNGRYLQKITNAVTNLIGGSGGSSSGGSDIDDLAPNKTEVYAKGMVTGIETSLNVRKGPGTNYEVIGSLKDGDVVQLVNNGVVWFKIKYGSGYGYVHSDYIIKLNSGNEDARFNVEPNELFGIITSNINGYDIRFRWQYISGKYMLMPIYEDLEKYHHAYAVNPIINKILSFGIGFVPGVGLAKEVVDFIVGKDIITGEEISRGTSLILNLSSVIFHNSFRDTDGIISTLKQASRKTIKLDPERIRFSQSSVNGAGEIIESMKKNGWKGDPIDVIKMEDGKLTTIDNTRVVAARKTKTNVLANIHEETEELVDKEMIERFTVKDKVPKTWGDAIRFRIGKQNKKFRENNPLGNYEIERIGM